MLQRRGEEQGGDTILSLLVTHTFQGLMGGGLSFGRVGPPRPGEGESWRLKNLGLLGQGQATDSKSHSAALTVLFQTQGQVDRGKALVYYF